MLALGCLLLALNAQRLHPNLISIFIIASCMSALTGLHTPSFQGLAQQIVSAKDFAAMSTLNMFIMSLVMIAGPALAGLIIAHSNVATAFSVDCASYTISLLAISLIRKVPRLEKASAISVWASLKEGLAYSKSRQELLGSYGVDFLAMLFGMPNALFPALAQHYGGVKVLGLLYSAPAVGALLISLFSRWTEHIQRYGKAIALAAIGWGVSIVGLGLAHYLALALFFLVLAGAFDAISGIFRQVLWNKTIPQNLRGRLAGIEMLSYLSGPRLGDTEAGLVAAAFGITASIVSGGVICVLGVGLCCYFMPKFWQFKQVDS